MSAVNRPQFFCTRPNGTLTPLVAMDEMPTHVTVRGVARTLTASETQGMTSCGMAAARSDPWVVDGLTSTRTMANKDGLAELQNILLKIISDDTVTPELRVAVQNILYRGLDHSCFIEAPGANGMAVVQANAPTYPGNNVGSKHFNNKKEYCSYWIRHGECDYQQQGCLYKHEMPTDPAMLEKLGLRDIPRWYREKYNVPSLLHQGHRGQQWKDDQGPFKAIQYSTNVPDDTVDHKAANGKYKVSPHRVASQPAYMGYPRMGAANVHQHGYHKKNGQRAPIGSDTTASSPDYKSEQFNVHALSNKLHLLSTTQSGPAAASRAYYDGHNDFVNKNLDDDIFAPMSTTTHEQQLRSSSGLFDAYNSDGGVKIKNNYPFNPFTRASGYRTSDSSSSTEMKSTDSPISKLADSDTLKDTKGIYDFGAIGSPVHRRRSSPSAQARESKFFVSGIGLRANGFSN